MYAKDTHSGLERCHPREENCCFSEIPSKVECGTVFSKTNLELVALINLRKERPIFCHVICAAFLTRVYARARFYTIVNYFSTGMTSSVHPHATLYSGRIVRYPTNESQHMCHAPCELGAEIGMMSGNILCLARKGGRYIWPFKKNHLWRNEDRLVFNQIIPMRFYTGVGVVPLTRSIS